MYYHFLAPTRLESWHPWSPKATWTNTTRITKSTALKRGTSRKRHKLGYGRIVVVMLVYIFMLSLFWPFSYSLMQFPPSILKLSTQHPPYFLKLSTQHQPAITHIENWAILPTQGLQLSYTLIRAFSKISAYTKTVQFYSTRNTSMNKFLAQSSSPCLMLGGIPPASLSEGCICLPLIFGLHMQLSHKHDQCVEVIFSLYWRLSSFQDVRLWVIMICHQERKTIIWPFIQLIHLEHAWLIERFHVS